MLVVLIMLAVAVLIIVATTMILIMTIMPSSGYLHQILIGQFDTLGGACQ
jgi:hypothetical protein